MAPLPIVVPPALVASAALGRDGDDLGAGGAGLEHGLPGQVWDGMAGGSLRYHAEAHGYRGVETGSGGGLDDHWESAVAEAERHFREIQKKRWELA